MLLVIYKKKITMHGHLNIKLTAVDSTVCVSLVTCGVTAMGSGDEGRLVGLVGLMGLVELMGLVGLVQAEEGGVVASFIHMNVNMMMMMMMMMIIIIIILGVVFHIDGGTLHEGVRE
jgi:hypothetical protein